MELLDASIAWSEEGLEGSRKFLWSGLSSPYVRSWVPENKRADSVYYETVKSVTEQIEEPKFNTAIAQLMIFVNAANKEENSGVEYAKGFIPIVCAFRTALAEELRRVAAQTGKSISYEVWPT